MTETARTRHLSCNDEALLLTARTQCDAALTLLNDVSERVCDSDKLYTAKYHLRQLIYTMDAERRELVRFSVVKPIA